jgi:ATP-binding cassette subfamily F protein uup
MHYVSADKIGKSFGIKPLFRDISFHISEGDKIGLIARNGSGKSTLLHILAGRETVDSGEVWINKEVNVALFEQQPEFQEELSVLENIFHLEHPVIAAIKNYEQASESGDPEALGKCIAQMDELNAWDFDAKVRQILGKLNIHNLDQPVNKLSGGQRKRVALAQTLIDIGFEHRHVLLIMDEPTNHLDVGMVEWLEHYLGQENVTLLLVTHDRYFLDAICEDIWEIDNSTLYTYHGDYETYLEQKAARIENQAASIDKARNEFRRELEWMRKQPKARTTKSRSREQNFYEVEARAKQKIDDQSLSLQMKMNRLGGKVAELKKVYKAYGDASAPLSEQKVILRGFDYTFKKGERIGVVGKNGAGKSTFLNMLQGLEPQDSGKINIGETIIFGNFSQTGLEIKEDMRVIEFVKNIAENFPLNNGKSLSAAQFLELFLFTPDQQYTYLSALSGGEKKRLQLLAVLFKNPNFLILDEPTNDLDLATLGVLERFLSEYTGCLLIVSHDRYFMDKLVDHLFVFEGAGMVRDFPGNYSQYRTWQKEQEILEREAAQKKKELEKPVVAAALNTSKPKKLSYKEQREFESLEREIPELESERERLATELSNPLPFDRVQALTARLTEINEALDEKEMRWLELSESL